MDNCCPEVNEDQYVTSPSGEYLGRYFHVRHSECNRTSPNRINLGNGMQESNIVKMLQVYSLFNDMGIIIVMKIWLK